LRWLGGVVFCFFSFFFVFCLFVFGVVWGGFVFFFFFFWFFGGLCVLLFFFLRQLTPFHPPPLACLVSLLLPFPLESPSKDKENICPCVAFRLSPLHFSSRILLRCIFKGSIFSLNLMTTSPKRTLSSGDNPTDFIHP